MAADLERELAVAKALAREAGKILLEVWATDFAVVEKPKGGGPVTEADRRANALVVEGLRQAFPGDGVVAEESPDTSDAARFPRCWYVDPMDGTTEFVDRTGDFAVHVGLAMGGEAVLGVVFRPLGDRLYAGRPGAGATIEEAGVVRALRVSAGIPSGGVRLVVSRSHKSKRTDDIMRELGVATVTELGSVGLKCGLLCEGGADLYLMPSKASWRWDTCAPEAILRGAGGVLTDLAGVPYSYDGQELRNLRGVIGATPEAFRVAQPIVTRIARESGFLPPSPPA